MQKNMEAQLQLLKGDRKNSWPPSTKFFYKNYQIPETLASALRTFEVDKKYVQE